MSKNSAAGLAVLCVLLSVAAASAQTEPTGTGTDIAVTYQVNYTHTGAISTPTLRPPLHIKWSIDLGAPVGYPLIAEGKVFVIAGPDAAGKVNLYALDAADGHTLWGPILIPQGAYWWAAAAYDNGVVYVVPNTTPGFQSGALYAFDAHTGQIVWNVTLPGQYFFTAPPTARNGIVYTSGAGGGGTLYAVQESDGALLWTAAVANGDNSSPAVTSGAVYVSYVCPQTYKFAAKTGKQIWHYNPGCTGGGGATPVLYQGLLYVRDWSRSNGHNGEIFNAQTGNYVGAFDADFAPGMFSKTAFYVQSGSINAVSTTTGTTIWSALPPAGDSFSTPPIIANGVLYVGTYSGQLLGYKALTGAILVSKSLGYTISAQETGSVGSPESGLGAGQGILVVPASTHLFALSHQ
jgi:outer membrane protein assembly factor BamB